MDIKIPSERSSAKIDMVVTQALRSLTRARDESSFSKHTLLENFVYNILIQLIENTRHFYPSNGNHYQTQPKQKLNE